jgi:ArsR family transcriptional regulator, cadmium/lead-responsive transcriptional repressor
VTDRAWQYHRFMPMDSRFGPVLRQGLAPAALLFHSLADPARLAIVQRLARGEARVVDLTRELELAQSTVSQHLACLRDCQLVDFRAEGRQSFYFLAQPALDDLLRAAERLLADTGEAVTLCPVYRAPVSEDGAA